MCCHNIVTAPFRQTTVSRCGLEDFETCSDHLSVFKLSLIQIFAVWFVMPSCLVRYGSSWVEYYQGAGGGQQLAISGFRALCTAIRISLWLASRPIRSQISDSSDGPRHNFSQLGLKQDTGHLARPRCKILSLKLSSDSAQYQNKKRLQMAILCIVEQKRLISFICTFFCNNGNI